LGAERRKYLSASDKAMLQNDGLAGTESSKVQHDQSSPNLWRDIGMHPQADRSTAAG
jgi:hypothetical protein